MYADHIYEAQKQLEAADFVADVLRRTALLEEDLDFTIALFFCAGGRHFPFMELVSSQLRFNSKIHVLETIPARKTLRSRAQALAGLRRFQKVRNSVAHSALLRPSKIQSMCADSVVKSMILDYPARLTDEFQTTRRSLYHLTRSREWRPNAKTDAPTRLDLFMESWHKRLYA